MLGTLKDWIDILVSVGNLCVPVVVAWIAYQQWRTTDKERKSKREQRYIDCYDQVLDAANKIVYSGAIPETSIIAYQNALTKADLFLPDAIGEEIRSQLEEIIKVQGLEQTLLGTNNIQDRQKIAGNIALLRSNILRYAVNLRALFRPHLTD